MFVVENVVVVDVYVFFKFVEYGCVVGEFDCWCGFGVEY